MKLAWLLWLSSVLPHSAADRLCLATTVYLEARSESVVGQMAVAEVALRRYASGQWGKTICDVVRARGQFALSTTNKNYLIEDVESWKVALAVSALTENIWTLPADLRMAIVPEADHFFSITHDAPNWAKGSPIATIGDHRFYHAD